MSPGFSYQVQIAGAKCRLVDSLVVRESILNGPTGRKHSEEAQTVVSSSFDHSMGPASVQRPPHQLARKGLPVCLALTNQRSWFYWFMAGKETIASLKSNWLPVVFAPKP